MVRNRIISRKFFRQNLFPLNLYPLKVLKFNVATKSPKIHFSKTDKIKENKILNGLIPIP